jgi:hypothetical protein
MASRPDVFVSATTGDLGTFRLAVRDTLVTMGAHPVVQDDFPSDYRRVVDMLRKKIDQCDAVISLVGFVYGQEPRDRPRGALHGSGATQ